MYRAVSLTIYPIFPSTCEILLSPSFRSGKKRWPKTEREKEKKRKYAYVFQNIYIFPGRMKLMEKWTRGSRGGGKIEGRKGTEKIANDTG